MRTYTTPIDSRSPQDAGTCCYKTMCFTYSAVWNLIYHFIHIESNKVLDCHSRLRREHIKDDCHGSYWVQFHWFLYYTLQQYRYMVIKEPLVRYTSVRSDSRLTSWNAFTLSLQCSGGFTGAPRKMESTSRNQKWNYGPRLSGAARCYPLGVPGIRG